MNAFPLQWPFGQNATPSHRRKKAPFKTTIVRSREELIRQLKMMGARNVVITTNLATYQRAGHEIPYANQSMSNENPGVAVYYSWKSEQYCMACDIWTTVDDNMLSIAKTVDAMRGIERWGSEGMVKNAFQGFKKLTAPAKKKWWEVLGVEYTAGKSEVENAYKKAAFQNHPDRGGLHEKMAEINGAYEDYFKSLQ